MASRSEQIRVAFHEALVAAAGPALPLATRNDALPQILDELPASGAPGAALNLVDGSIVDRNETLGPDRVYDLGLIVELEWIVQAASQTDRDAAFDAGLVAINDVVEAIEVDAEQEKAPWHGLIGSARVTGIEGSNLAIDGVPQLKGGVIGVTFEFTSYRPF